MDGYSAAIEQKMQRFCGWLSEKDRRRYAAVEAAKLGHGGVKYIARILGCDPQTIRQGLRDLEEAEDAAAFTAYGLDPHVRLALPACDACTPSTNMLG